MRRRWPPPWSYSTPPPSWTGYTASAWSDWSDRIAWRRGSPRRMQPRRRCQRGSSVPTAVTRRVRWRPPACRRSSLCPRSGFIDRLKVRVHAMALFLFISSIYNGRLWIIGRLDGPSLDFSSLEFYCVSIEHNVRWSSDTKVFDWCTKKCSFLVVLLAAIMKSCCNILMIYCTVM